jgi:hypothetical protein
MVSQAAAPPMSVLLESMEGFSVHADGQTLSISAAVRKDKLLAAIEAQKKRVVE